VLCGKGDQPLFILPSRVDSSEQNEDGPPVAGGPFEANAKIESTGAAQIGVGGKRMVFEAPSAFFILRLTRPDHVFIAARTGRSPRPVRAALSFQPPWPPAVSALGTVGPFARFGNH
jgi:hypothetical protein